MFVSASGCSDAVPQEPFCRVLICRVLICLGDTWTLSHTHTHTRAVTHDPVILFPRAFCDFKSLACAAMEGGRQRASRPQGHPYRSFRRPQRLSAGSATSGPIGMERKRERCCPPLIIDSPCRRPRRAGWMSESWTSLFATKRRQSTPWKKNATTSQKDKIAEEKDLRRTASQKQCSLEPFVRSGGSVARLL